MQHGGLKASFLKYPPFFTDSEPERCIHDGLRDHRSMISCADGKAVLGGAASSASDASSAVRRDINPGDGTAYCQSRQCKDTRMPGRGAVAVALQFGGCEHDTIINGRRSRAAYQKLTASAAAKARPPVQCARKNRSTTELRHRDPEQDEAMAVRYGRADLRDDRERRDRCLENLESDCMDEALTSGAFAAMVKESAAFPVASEQLTEYHAVVHSLPAQRIAGQLMEAGTLQTQISEISGRSSKLQNEAQVSRRACVPMPSRLLSQLSRILSTHLVFE